MPAAAADAEPPAASSHPRPRQKPRPGKIDVHSHFLPEVYQSALAAAGISQPDGMSAVPAWSAEAALAAMDRLGIATQMLSISSPGIHLDKSGDLAATVRLARQVNEAGADIVRKHPGRFGFFAITPLPDVGTAVAEACHSLDVLKADGIVLETNFHGAYLGNARLAPLFAVLNERAAVVFIHPTSPACPCCAPAGQEAAVHAASAGYPRPMLEFMFETTRTVTDMVLSGVLDRYPNIKVIVPHAGAALPVLAGRVELMAPSLGTVDGKPRPGMRDAMRKLHFDLAGVPVPELLEALLKVADPSRLHYGSDFPFTPVEACEVLLAALDQTPLLEGGLREKAMHGNSAQLFPRLVAAR
ncbi:MAG: amidohydrolase [Comamonadaceae bacterium]|nr:MAG: amidohydrolase [Comamonadaceae bacterium]